MNTNPSRIARSRSFVYPQINHFIEARKFYLNLYLKLHGEQFIDVPFEHLWNRYSDRIDMVLEQHNCFQQANQSFKPIIQMLLSNERQVVDNNEHIWWSLSISIPVDHTSLMIDLTLKFKTDYYFGTGLLSEHLKDNNNNAFRMEFKIYPSQNGYFNSQEQTTIFQINNQLVQTMKTAYPFVCGERLYEWLSETNT